MPTKTDVLEAAENELMDACEYAQTVLPPQIAKAVKARYEGLSQTMNFGWSIGGPDRVLAVLVEVRALAAEVKALTAHQEEQQ